LERFFFIQGHICVTVRVSKVATRPGTTRPPKLEGGSSKEDVNRTTVFLGPAPYAAPDIAFTSAPEFTGNALNKKVRKSQIFLCIECLTTVK
jgi:hypothetical protein